MGDRRCVALLDGSGVYRADRYFANAAAEHVTPVLQRYGIPAADRIPSTFTCLAIEQSTNQWTLLDTGLGLLSPTAGRLHANLIGAGISPASVRTVVLTHAHPDHIGANLDTEGKPRYPNAQFVILAPEWDFWTSEQGLSKVPKSWADTARQQLLPLRDRILQVSRETEVAAGVTLVPAVGHTPGHAIAVVHSGASQLHYISDTALHPIHLEEPGWETSYDMDRPRAAAARRVVFDRAASERALVLGFHFHPFPSVGVVTRAGRGWRWEASVQ